MWKIIINLNNNRRILSTVLFVALFAIIMLASSAVGQEGGDGIEIPAPGGLTDIMELFDKIWGFIFTISVPITAIIIMVGGIQMATAAGDEEKIKKAKKTITWAVIGFSIIILAGGLVKVIQNFFEVDTGTTPPPPPSPTLPTTST